MSALAEVAWPEALVGDAIRELARRHGMPTHGVHVSAAPASLTSLGVWVDRVCASLGLEAEPLTVAVSDLHESLAGAAPALVRLPSGQVLAVTRATSCAMWVIHPDYEVRRIRTEDVLDALLPTGAAAQAIDAVLDAGEVRPARRTRARSALARAMLSGHRISGLWLVRLPPSASFAAQLRRIRIPSRIGALLAAYALATLLVVLGFSLMGRAALDGRIDAGWLAAWALIVAIQVPLSIYVDWAQAQVAVDFGAALKQRLFAGALGMEGDAVRSAGAGELLGRALESEVIESAALTGGFSALTAVVEIALALAVLWLGASGGAASGLLVACTALGGAAGVSFVRRRRELTAARLVMTHDLVERMVGHRTRLAQDSPAHWHDGEDDMLRAYLTRSGALDASSVRLTALVPKLWLFASVAVLSYSFIDGSATQASLAITLGGIVMGERALRRAAHGATSLGAAAVAWETIAPLFRAGGRATPPPDADVGHAAHEESREDDVVEMREVYFRHRPTGEPVLAGASLRLGKGDRVLLEGRSGSGKSTLASILCGLREAQSGLVLASGLDRRTLGLDGWRRRVASAPQFHENHIISSSLAFNLLLGRRWPPRAEDLADAHAVCAELGLEPLIERMPSGMQQTIGETGWQLSHGEMSRIFIARGLLQAPDVVVLDESLAALDPETLSTVLGTVKRRARALVVIAHP